MPYECACYVILSVTWEMCRFVPGAGPKAEGAAKLDASQHGYLPEAEAKPEVVLMRHLQSVHDPFAMLLAHTRSCGCLHIPTVNPFEAVKSHEPESSVMIAGASQPGVSAGPSRASSARQWLPHVPGGRCRGAGCRARCELSPAPYTLLLWRMYLIRMSATPKQHAYPLDAACLMGEPDVSSLEDVRNGCCLAGRKQGKVESLHEPLRPAIRDTLQRPSQELEHLLCAWCRDVDLQHSRACQCRQQREGNSRHHC